MIILDRSFILDYLDSLRCDIDTIEDYFTDELIEIYRILLEARLKNRRVFLCGNGGSSCVASHISQDLVKMCYIDSTCLTDSIPTITAISNDISYNKIFTEQLKILAKPDDILIVFTGSGNSKNILNALTYAKYNNMKIISIVGTDGGELLSKSPICSGQVTIHIEDDMQKSEDLFVAIFHILIQKLCIKNDEEDK